MPRQHRRPPSRLGRFTYWSFSAVVPQDADEIAGVKAMLEAEVPDESERDRIGSFDAYQGHQACRRQFLAHRDGRACGIVGCSIDSTISETPDERNYLAVLHYARADRLWTQDADAQAVMKTLPLPRQHAIRAAAAKAWAAPQRDQGWDALLATIAKDQQLFGDIITKHATADADRDEVADAHGVAANRVRTVYQAYSPQRQYLLGRVVGAARDALQRRGITVTQFDHPIIPLQDDDGCPLDPQARDHLVMHWFAHALRNLRCLRDGNRPIPWSADCATVCLRERDKLASVQRPSPSA